MSGGAELGKGQNVAIPTGSTGLRVVVAWHDASGVEVDGSALLLGSDRKVRSDADLVFYNQPVSSDGAVQHLGKTATGTGMEEGIGIDLEALPTAIASIAVTASVSDGTFGDLERLSMFVTDQDGAPVARYEIVDASAETAIVFAEIYRREGAWRVRAVGQGWATGLAGLATDFGVTVEDDEGQAAADSTVPTPDPVAAASTTPHDALPLTASPEGVPGDGSSLVAPRRAQRGVRTRKAPIPVVLASTTRLADDPSWQAARLFSISGVGSPAEQEKRATSALLATMLSVKPFARAICGRLGAPAGAVETFLEVQFALGEGRVIPDGLIRVVRGPRQWTCLLEVKTGTSQLRLGQVEAYMDVAREQRFDAVATLSNEISPGAGEHPLQLDQRRTKKVALFHLSWAEVLHEAKVVLQHRGVDDATQGWILGELVRYLEHPRSGVVGFDDMGPSWVPVRDAVAAGTLRASDRKVPAVAESWLRLVRHLALRLSADLGVTVTQRGSRGAKVNSSMRTSAAVEQLVGEGVLSTSLKVPGAAGPIHAMADLRTAQVRISTTIPAPQEGSSHRRSQWILKQLRGAPDDLLVEVQFARQAETTCEQLKDLRDGPGPLLVEQTRDVVGFVLTKHFPLGSKRSGVKGAFIPSITDSVESFYVTVLQPLQAWVPPAPTLLDDPGDHGGASLS